MQLFRRISFLNTVAVSLSLTIIPSKTILANDLTNAPHSFPFAGSQAVAIDITDIHLDIAFNVASSKATGSAKIYFTALENGFPIFDLVPAIKSAKFSNASVEITDIPIVADPDHVTKFRVLKRKVVAGESYELDLVYDLKEGISFENSEVKAGFFMSDLVAGGRGYWEQYGPSNGEFDQYKQTVNIAILNSSIEHTVYTNAVSNSVDRNTWKLSFPEYFTASSFYLHIAAKDRFVERSAVFVGASADIPVLVYAEDAELADNGLTKSLEVLAENEKTFGPFSHPRALAYMTPGTGDGGMEYCGATMTSLKSLGHEFTHFWFARGVMPSDGNAGWIDEAVASWRDAGYARSPVGPSGIAYNLGGFSSYRRQTTLNAYTAGRDLIGQFDKQFESFSFEGQTGMRAILRALFSERQHMTITVDFFKVFMERLTGANLTKTFARYVYGINAKDRTEISLSEKLTSPHHHQYSDEELKRYR
jgi:hypothetical protein